MLRLSGTVAHAVLAHLFRAVLVFVLLWDLQIVGAIVAPVQAKKLEGTLHGFLEMSNSEGKVIAQGNLLQIVNGNRVSARLLFHFKDGSVDDETTVFSQGGDFRLISYHHIQKGPFFPHPIDLSMDIAKNEVTVRSTKDGKEEIKTEQLRLPPDLYNGMVTAIVKNLRHEVPETKVSMVVALLNCAS